MNVIATKDVQLSPCIISKAKLALGLKELNGEINSKKCSAKYWKRVVDVVGDKYKVPQSKIDGAIGKYNQFCR